MKTAVCALAFVALLLLGDLVSAGCIVKNESSKDIELIPIVDINVHIVVRVGEVVEVPPQYKDCHVKNLGNGAQTLDPIALVDGLVVVVVDGAILGTVKILLGALIDGVISILSNAVVIVQI